MKLGFVSAILADFTFEEMIDCASEMGYQCVEVACWPQGKAERRYAGVSHINVDELSDEKAAYLQAYCREKNVEISSLAYYPNTLDPDLDKRAAAAEHLKKLIAASKKLGVNMVTTFIGRDQTKTVEENLELFEQVWKPLIALAEENQVKIGIENCPMLFDAGQWPGGQNLATTPKIWREMFSRIPSEYFGLNYDPSHFVWQRIDYLKPLYEFKDKISMSTIRISSCIPTGWTTWGSWGIPWSTWLPSFPDWGMWTGARTFPPCGISVMTGIPAWR